MANTTHTEREREKERETEKERESARERNVWGDGGRDSRAR
eukprot:COSAG03_NODE_22322_length_292_cov_1.077720_2_plen_40_part_01